MKFFDKIRHIKKKTILAILMPLVFIFVSFIVFINLNNTTNLTDLPLSQNPEKNVLDSRLREIERMAQELEEQKKELERITQKLEEDKVKNERIIIEELEKKTYSNKDLLYRYEPYYILEGWNYVEEKRHQNTQTITDTF
jgi:hypothetical protein